MEQAEIDPPVPFLVSDLPLRLILVGCGGTGSHLAQHIARIAVQARDLRMHLQVIFMDGDTIEPKNIGRQLFAPAEIGQNKALSLAARFNRTFGLSIIGVPYMLNDTTANGAYPFFDEFQTIFIGAVDNATARKAIQKTSGGKLWLDSGNHRTAGQVCLGDVPKDQPIDLYGAFAMGATCTALPDPFMQWPGLMAEEERPVEQLDCATAMVLQEQSLMVNSQMAQITAMYLDKLVLHRSISIFQTVVDIEGMAMRSWDITARNIAEVSGITIEQLTTALEIRTTRR